MPLASLNNDIRQYALNNGGTTSAFENTKSAQLYIHISVKGRILMTLAFTSTQNLRREGGDLAILVDGVENASKSEIDAVAQSRESIACIIVPDRDILQTYDKLQAAHREIVLHLHFSPNRQTSNRFSFSDEMKEPELLSRARNIVKNFPGARFFTITAERLHGNNAAIVSDELRNSGIRQIESSMLIYLDRSGGEETMATRINDLSSMAIRDGRAFGVAELKGRRRAVPGRPDGPTPEARLRL